MELCLSPLLTAMFQFEQQENTNFFHKPVKPAAQTPVSRNTLYRDDNLSKSTVYNWYNQFKNSQVLSMLWVCETKPVTPSLLCSSS
jgi:hypothetical protein